MGDELLFITVIALPLIHRSAVKLNPRLAALAEVLADYADPD